VYKDKTDIEDRNGYYHCSDDGEITYWRWTGKFLRDEKVDFRYVEGKKIPKHIIRKFINMGFKIKNQ
jgi:hypothetical protein